MENLEVLNAEQAPVKREPKKDKQGRSYASGRRKDAVARVWVKLGKGNVTVNGKEMKDYFTRPVLQMIINQPFVATAREGQFDVVCTVCGGGLSGVESTAPLGGTFSAYRIFSPDISRIAASFGWQFRIVNRYFP